MQKHSSCKCACPLNGFSRGRRLFITYLCGMETNLISILKSFLLLPSPSSVLTIMELLNKDFEHFFSSLKKDEIATVCQPLFDYQRKVTWKKWSKFVLGFVIIYFLNLWSENVNWFFTALGRILLIQILPMWNWSKLYNAKCLIDRPIVNDNYIKPITNNYPGDIDNCLLCESIGKYLDCSINFIFKCMPTFRLYTNCIEYFFLDFGK